MARTSQKAQKTTGGVAPRLNLSHTALPLGNIQLTTKAASATSATSLAMPLASSLAAPLALLLASSKLAQVGKVLTSTHNSYCYICVNGGNLTECDRCSRVMCSEHIDLPAGAALAIRDALFICIACHLKVCGGEPAPYFVSGSIFCYFVWQISL
jgi:hypothetical protein